MGNHIKSILHITAFIVACVMMQGYFSQSSFAQQLSEEDVYDVILEVKRDRQTLATAIFGLEKDGQYFLPIQELARIVDFNITTSLKNGTATGFFFSEENLYSIDVNNNLYVLRGNSNEFDSADAFIFSQQFGVGDIYVTPELLNKIWPLDLSLDKLKQTLNIQTNKKLPYEISQLRQRKRNNLLERNKTQGPSNTYLPRIRNEYRTFTLPAIDVSSTTRAGGQQNGIGQNVYVRGRNDLFKSSASYNFNIDKEQEEDIDITNARFLLERKSYEQGDLPLDLQLMQLGDIRPRPSRLIDGVLVGRGFLASSEPTKRIKDFDQIVVEGVSEPGWEVELYRNNELIDFQIVDSTGEYRFEDITLDYSNTIIKTILYGPEGQVREEEQNYNISENMLRPGEMFYEVSALDLNEDLFPVNDRSKNRPTGIALNSKLKRGINDWLSAFTSFTSTPTRRDDRKYVTAGVDVSLGSVSGLAEFYKDLSGGEAYDFRAATKFYGANVNLRTSLFSGFESQEANFDDLARTSHTEFSISKPIRTFLGNLGFRFKADNQNFESAADRTQFDFSQTYAKNALRLTHGNTFNIVDGDRQNSDGRINATYRINPNWQIRSLFNYNIDPEWDIRNLFTELRYRDRKKFSAAVDVNRDFQNQGTKLGAQVSYDFERFRLGLNTDWDKDEGLSALLRVSSSMAPYGDNGEYIFSSQNLSNRASLNGLTYYDKNYDGIYNEGDEPVEGAIIDIGRRETDISTSDGIARYVGSPKEELEDIYLNLESLNNPFTVSGVDGYSGLLRPATSMYVEFPVLETGIVEGVVSTSSEPLAGVRMELLENENVVDTTSTAFDGYYIFEYVEPGSYTVRIDPTYEQITIPPREISVTSENLFLNGIDFQILEQADEVACANQNINDGRITQDTHDDMALGGIQPAHSNSHCRDQSLPTVTNVRMAQRPDYLRMVLDYDQKPQGYEIIEAQGNKEVSIVFSDTNWDVNKKWENPNPKFLKSYSVEHLPDGKLKMILSPHTTMRIKKSAALDANLAYGHRIYFDVIN